LAVEVLLDLADEAADARAVLRVAVIELGPREALVEVLEDRHRLPQREAIVDDGGNGVARVDRHELRRLGVVVLEREDLEVVGELVEFQREPDAPGEGGAVSVVEVESHREPLRGQSSGTISSATMLMILMSGFTAGPAVSL